MATGTALPRPPPMSSTTAVVSGPLSNPITIPQPMTTTPSASNHHPTSVPLPSSSTSASSASCSPSSTSISNCSPSSSSSSSSSTSVNRLTKHPINNQHALMTTPLSLPWLPDQFHSHYSIQNHFHSTNSNSNNNPFDLMLLDKGKENYLISNHTTDINHLDSSSSISSSSQQIESLKLSSFNHVDTSKCIDLSSNSTQQHHNRHVVVTKETVNINNADYEDDDNEVDVTVQSLVIRTDDDIDNSHQTNEDLQNSYHHDNYKSISLTRSTATITTTGTTNTTTNLSSITNETFLNRKDFYLDYTNSNNNNKFLSVANCL
ncbi:unnamed protein product [Schistosoma turkestanicum]|nr:unnamed protein product [Schistosoma turkestanicum]